MTKSKTLTLHKNPPGVPKELDRAQHDEDGEDEREHGIDPVGRGEEVEADRADKDADTCHEIHEHVQVGRFQRGITLTDRGRSGHGSRFAV